MNANILLQRVLKKFEDNDSSGGYVCHTLAIVVKEHVEARNADEYGMNSGDWIIVIEAAAKLHAAISACLIMRDGSVGTFGTKYTQVNDLSIGQLYGEVGKARRIEWLRASLECDAEYTKRTGVPLIDWQKADRD